MTARPRETGDYWEERAARLLARNGLKILERSWRCRGGELDLVCRDGEQLVIVEVRARRSHSHGGASASVGPAKIRRIVYATRHYLMKHPDLAAAPVRFDVIAVEDHDSADRAVHWIRNAFEGC